MLIRSLASLMMSRSGAVVARCAALAFWRLFRRQLAGRFVAPCVVFAAFFRSLPLDVRVILQHTQSGVQRGGVRRLVGLESKQLSAPKARSIVFVTS